MPASLLDVEVGLYCESLRKKNINSAMHAALDAIDIWLGCVRYVFDFVNPISGNLAVKSMLMFLETDIGAKIYLSGLAFSGFFGFSANYFSENLMWGWGKIANENWPYVRDAFKALKWTFRGVRNLFVILEKIHWVDCTPYISSLGLGFGFLAATNRWAIRELVENRKNNKDFNKLLQQHVKNFQAVFVKLQNKPEEEFLFLYKNTIIQCEKEPSQFYVVDQHGQIMPLEGEPEFLESVEKISTLKNRLDLADFYQQLQREDLRVTPGYEKLAECFQAKKKSLESTDVTVLLHSPIYQQHQNFYVFRSMLNGVFNAPYYFLGAVLMINLSPNYFFWGLVFSSVCCVLNIAAEYIQEREYQRELNITARKAEMSLLKRLVSLEADFKNLNPDNYDLTRQNEYIESYNLAKTNLFDLLVLDSKYLCFQGVRNGLLCYGIINGCLNTLSTIAFLYHWTFMTETVFAASIGLGLVLLAFGLGYTLYVGYYTKAPQAIDAAIPIQTDQHFTAIAWKCIHDQNDIQATPNPLISPQCEILRQGLTGEKKAVKLLQTSSAIFPNLSPDNAAWSFYLYPTLGVFYVFEFCCKGIRAMVQSEDKSYRQSTTWRALTFFDKKPQGLLNVQAEVEYVNSLLVVKQHP